MIDENKVPTLSQKAIPAMGALHKPVSNRNDMWILLWSLFLGGVNIHIAGREPVLLYFDVVLVFWLIYSVFWKGRLIGFSDWILRLGVFCLLMETLSALVNYHDMYKSLAAIKVLGCGLVVYAIARRTPPSPLMLSLWGAVAGILLLINFQAVQFGEYNGEGGLKDVIGIELGRSNYVASILLLLIPIAIAAVSLHKGATRWVCVGCGMFMLAGLVTTMSRGAMLAVVLAAIASLPLMYRAGLHVKHLLPMLGLIAVVAFLLPAELLRANAAFIAYRLENADETRPQLMKGAWESFTENPVLGVGPGQVGNAIASHMMVPTYDPQHMNAHNLVLDALAENGLPAGFALLTMVGIILYRAFMIAALQPSALSVGLWVAFLAAVIHNMVEASFEGQQFQVIFWAVAGMVEARHNHLVVAIKPSA
ncbi:MAG TPA: O-antigen ligase family protein [Nitrososphaera sp.]|nr:O-antigen ligase family protein [Nitrososphaera sp.]